MGILNILSRFDERILLAVNALAGNPVLDQVMVFSSSKIFWIPLYAYIAYILWKQYGTQQFYWIVLAATLMIVLTDQGSVKLFKEVWQRPRPCHVPVLEQQLHLVAGKCGGAFGFISSHASNVFGLATFTFLLLKQFRRWWAFMFLWAALVSLSRVYLAVHYPLDVLVGAMYGSLVGLSMAVITERTIGKECTG